MAVSLSKGGNISLTKTVPGLLAVVVGLGWSARKTDGEAYDLDASAFMVDANDKVINEKGFVFYGNKTSEDGSVVHAGDNRTGAGDGDDESISIDLAKVPANCVKIVIGVTIHEAAQRNQTFGQVEKAYARVLNSADQVEIARFDLSEDASTNTAQIFCELYRGADAGEFKFKAIGSGYEGGLPKMAADYGINVA